MVRQSESKSFHRPGKRIAKIVQSLKSFASLDKADFQQVDIHEGLESALALFERDFANRIEVIREFGTTPAITCCRAT